MIVIAIGAIFLFGHKSEYEKIMKPVRKQKILEKESGKLNPVFDGIVEPDFPEETENNKTLEGIDSNGDGLRDNIEIWINRVSEDKYVRLSLKFLAKKHWDANLAAWKNEAEPVVRKKSFENVEALMCLSIVLIPYHDDYLKKGIS